MATKKPEGAGAEKTGESPGTGESGDGPKPVHTNARARGYDESVVYSALTDWLEGVAAGETERTAAVPVFTKYGVPFRTLRSWCDRDPDGWGDALAQAHAVKEARWLGVVDSIAQGKGASAIEDPGVLRAKLSAATWLLSKSNRSLYGDHKTTELTGANGGPVKQEVQVRGLIRVPPSKLRPQLPETTEAPEEEPEGDHDWNDE